jgi:hypothetical protein
LIFDRAPPFRGKLTNLGRTFRHPHDEATLAVNDTNKPVSWDVVRREKAHEFPPFYHNGKPAKRLVAFEDGDLDSGNQILSGRTSQEVGYHDRTRGECSALRCQRYRIAVWQEQPRLGESVHELLAIYIRDHYAGIRPGRERAACLSLERVKIVIKQRG